VTPAFRSKLRVEDDGGFPFTLLEPLVFDSAVLGGTVIVPTGFKTDFASIPRGLWNILPPVGKYDAGAVCHDLLYREGAFNGRAIERGDADKVLREAMEVCAVGRAQRRLIYAGLRVGGWLVWRRYRNSQGSRLKAQEQS
jgi:hypothetical protein